METMPKPLHRRPALYLILLGLLAAVYSIDRGFGKGVGSDAYVYWLAGRNFFSGAPLYLTPTGVREYIYPPFAAMAFQLLALFPFKVSASLLCFANLALVPILFRLSARLLRALHPSLPGLKRPMILAVLCTLGFFLDNIAVIQINEVVFALVLLGLLAFPAGREVRTGLFFAGATMMKVFPVFFLAWMVGRGRKRMVLIGLLTTLAFLLLPVFQRGWEQSRQDWVDYYDSFLGKFTSGYAITSFRNQSLSGLVYRAGRPPTDEGVPDYRYLELTEEGARTVTRVAVASVLLALLVNTLVLRKRREQISAFEISSVILASHLVAGRTSTTHLVTLSFVFLALFAIPLTHLRGWRRGFVFVLWGLIGANAINGEALLGDLRFVVAGYSFPTWVMLGLFLACLYLSQVRWMAEESAQPRWEPPTAGARLS